MNPRVRGFTGLIFASLLSPTIFAQTLDANYTPASLFVGVADAQSQNLAQTFTVTQNGLLSSIDLLVGRVSAGLPNAPLTLDIRTLAGSAPTEPDSGPNILGSSTIPATSLATSPAQWTIFTFSPISVTAGQKLALALTSAASDLTYYWVGDLNVPGVPAGTYSEGQAFTRGVGAQRAPGDPTSSFQWGNPYLPGGPPSGGTLVDFGFRTFLSVPEPSTGTVLLLGALAHLAVLRLRKPR